MDINGASILVTGGAGLIGSSTIDLLLRRYAPAQIVVLDDLVRGSLANLDRAPKDPRVAFVQGDICDVDLVNRVTNGMDAVMHFAALRIPACAADTRRAMQVMCAGSFNLVDAAHEAGVKKVVAASSASIYGLAQSFPTREDHHPYDNRTGYRASKVMLEGPLRSHHTMYGLPYVAMRYCNVYGPRMELHGKCTEMLIRWMDRIAARQPPLIMSDGHQTMEFVYIDDVARSNVLALASVFEDGVFNVANGTETSLNDLAAALLKVMGSGLRPEYGAERGVNPVPRRLADTSKAERLLGFKSQVNLEDGLARRVDWWQHSKSLVVQA